MKVAVITGAASGIGLALTQICLKKEMNVVMVDVNSAKLDEEATQLLEQFPGQVFPSLCDVTNPDEVEQLAQLTFNELGRVDWIFNNAGIIGPLAPLWELHHKDIHQVMNVNVYGMTHMIRAFTPYLLKQEFKSHIINMASLYALNAGSQVGAYTMSKHAVLALSESLYFDFKRLDKPIHVSVVFPSFTDTSLLSNNSSDADSPVQEYLDYLLSHSRSAADLANEIVREVELHRFYILPDKEVRTFFEERSKAILSQNEPHMNQVEKIMDSLVKRKKKTT